MLIRKYINGDASVEEIVAINKWLKEADANKSVFVAIKEELASKEKANSDWEKFADKYSDSLKPNRKIKRLVGFISLAASISLVVGVYFQLLKSDKTPYADFISESVTVPEQTTLSLSNGKVIELENKHSVLTLDSEGQQINLSNNQVIQTAQQSDEEAAGVNQVVVPYGRTAEVDLADGTKVWLNAGSCFIFPSHFNNQKKREVVLIGEAFFDVKHNARQPFMVVTEEMVYTVLGTSFNIQSYANSNSVAAVLVEGSLQVEKKSVINKHKTILKPGQKSQLYINQDKLCVTNVNTSFYTSWKDGYLMLYKNGLKNLVKQIEQYYHSELVISDELMNLPTQLSGKLLLDENPEQVYKTLCDLTGMTYEVKNNKVVFNKK